MKLLIVEDEPDLSNALKKGFQREGYALDQAFDGEEGLGLFEINEYDLIILDLGLPKMDGLQVLKAIRKNNKAQRIIILSARGDIESKIEGLDLGANDYLPKPFDFKELKARVRSLLNRSFIQESSRIHFGALSLDTAVKALFARGKRIDMTSREYAITEYLILNRQRVISAEELIEHVWASDDGLFSASLKVHMSNIRKKLRTACGYEALVNKRGLGYQIAKEEEE